MKVVWEKMDHIKSEVSALEGVKLRPWSFWPKQWNHAEGAWVKALEGFVKKAYNLDDENQQT